MNVASASPFKHALATALEHTRRAETALRTGHESSAIRDLGRALFAADNAPVTAPSAWGDVGMAGNFLEQALAAVGQHDVTGAIRDIQVAQASIARAQTWL